MGGFSRNPFVVRASIRTDVLQALTIICDKKSQSLRSQGIDSDSFCSRLFRYNHKVAIPS